MARTSISAWQGMSLNTLVPISISGTLSRLAASLNIHVLRCEIQWGLHHSLA
jgi:hypothetical protein